MRARHRHFLAALITAITVALAPASAPSALSVQGGDDPLCPQGTSWDNRVQRCV